VSRWRLRLLSIVVGIRMLVLGVLRLRVGWGWASAGAVVLRGAVTSRARIRLLKRR
jgi:hypothetical protein